MSNGPSSQTGLRELVSAKKLNSVDRSDWIAVSEISVPVGSKGELNHRSDHRANNRINRRAYHPWMNNRRLMDPRGRPGGRHRCDRSSAEGSLEAHDGKGVWSVGAVSFPR